MKKFNYFITPFIILLLPIITYASCSEEELKHFERIKEKYKIEYNIDKETGYYTLILHNPDPTKYTYEIKGLNTSIDCDISTTTDSKCTYIPPDGYSINVIGNTETCNSILKRSFLRLQKYNKYSEDPICNGIEEFVLCQETYDKEIDYETFVSRVNIYKEQKSNKNNNNKKIIDIKKIKEYIEDNLYEVIVIATFVVLVIITIIITIINTKKSRRLE